MLRRRYEGEKLNRLDGLLVEIGDAWFHARASNTEPVIRLVAEAPSGEGARKLMEEIKRAVESFLHAEALR
jgi:phosphomannomutase